MIYNVEINDVLLDIEYIYEEGEKMEYAGSNGDPGTPGCSGSIEIIAIYTSLSDKNNNNIIVNVLPIKTAFTINFDCLDIEDIILKYHEE
tara:strand:- start:4120 stop:4389 length:270 start_codon:yes stop_codon:yes gene_type:complete